MKADRLILIILAAVALVKFASAFPIDNNSIPGGTDVAHFLTNTWYVATYGLTKWNYFWYGGFPFLRYYPPLAFLITGGIAKFVGVLLSYKLVNDLFIALIPFAFYAFLREFNLPREKEIVAFLTFSFIPIFAYFLADGRFPTLINVFFSLLYWKYLKRSLDDKKFYNISIAAILLSLSLITHHTTTFLFIIISIAWAFIYKTRVDTLKKLAAIGILTVALTAWWSAPFFLETITTSKSGLYFRAVGEVYTGDIIYRIRTSVLENAFYASNLEPYLIVILAAFISVISLLALTNYKNKINRDSILLAIFIVALVFIIRYERSVIYLSVPVAFIVAEGLSVLKKNFRFIATVAFITILTASYLLIRPQIFAVPDYPNVPKDGRVIFFPIGSAYDAGVNQVKNYYDVILSPINGQENIFGWHDESQLVGNNAANKVNYLNELRDPLSTDKTNYYNLLKAGYINYVVVNKSDTEIVSYFENPKFSKILSDNMFVAYELNPKSTYVEFNGKPTQSTVKKTNDMIEIDTNCQKGTIVVKESYHKMWHASVNGISQDIGFNDFGFIQFGSNVDGGCKIILRFEDPQYYLLFYLISFAATLFVLYNILKKF